MSLNRTIEDRLSLAIVGSIIAGGWAICSMYDFHSAPPLKRMGIVRLVNAGAACGLFLRYIIDITTETR